MDLYEYQGKQLFARFGIPVSEGRLATTPEEARAAAEELGGQVVVKAQVLTGGRGKAGGIQLADAPDEAEARAPRHPRHGHPRARRRERLDREGLRDRDASTTSRSRSTAARRSRSSCSRRRAASTSRRSPRATPDALARLHIDPLVGFQPFQARWLVFTAGLEDPDEQKQVLAIVGKLYDAFVGTDAMLCEINPLIVTPDGEVKALDSKFTVDDNALYRHTDIAEMRDPEAGDPQERLAREKGVTYVKLDGEIGILGNGAGLVMSTLDVIDQVGGRPANFCDLGGGGDAEGVVDALEVITADAQVEAILFNIFGGITRGDEVARGILEALDRMTIDLPIVVRLDGTNAAEGRRHARRGGAAEPLRRGDDALRRGARRRAGEGAQMSRLGRAGRGLPDERGAPRGRGSRPPRRVGAAARARRSTSRRAAAMWPGACARPGSTS